MKRRQSQYLKEWKGRVNRKPLILRGARQVGKTHLLRQFGAAEFENLVEINFDDTPEKVSLFASNDIDQILSFLELDQDTSIRPGKTLLFLDEIQSCPSVIATLRYFYEKRPELHVVAAGSLLDFVLADHDFSMPVGRIEYLFVGPLLFQEFLDACGQERLTAYLESYQLGAVIPEAIHRKVQHHQRLYAQIGGMPSAVATFAASGDFNLVRMEQASIMQTYREDFSKYSSRVNVANLRKVLDAAPRLIGRKLKYTAIDREVRAGDLRAAIEMLKQARVLYPVRHSSGNGVPLRAEVKDRDYKLLFLDVGLMLRALNLKITELRSDDAMVNEGAISEQFVGQHLLASAAPYEEPELHYWNREKRGAAAEIDYLWEYEDIVVPIEVKSGATGSLKSLHVFATSKTSRIAVRFNLDVPSLLEIRSQLEPKSSFQLLSLPLYLIGQLPRLLASIHR